MSSPAAQSADRGGGAERRRGSARINAAALAIRREAALRLRGQTPSVRWTTPPICFANRGRHSCVARLHLRFNSYLLRKQRETLQYLRFLTMQSSAIAMEQYACTAACTATQGETFAGNG